MANVFFKINMNNKTIILSPISSGKSFFICSQGKHNSYCNEYLSTENNYIKDKNINMGGTSPIIPTSHPLYKSWDEVYKIGVRIFSEMDSNNKFLIFNGGLELDFDVRSRISQFYYSTVHFPPKYTSLTIF